VDVVIGTEEEFFAALAADPTPLLPGQPVSDSQRQEVEQQIEALLANPLGPAEVVLKRGAHGASVFSRQRAVIDVPGFAVQVLNTVGAGDAFASGLLYGFLQGWDWHKSVRMGNACGALVVTRHGCSEALPYEQEAFEFIESQGGF
jgi:5-dehydro-2-deoxygluconokinase